MLDIFKPFRLGPDGDVIVLEAFRELETDQQVVDDITNVFPNARLVERGPAIPSYGRDRQRQCSRVWDRRVQQGSGTICNKLRNDQ
ncbi:hypothetical protein BGZ88_006385 [Linnemannia elongata]|nr:hypothetical protein BGZ88_006385 [Linnemannia elongata]